MLEAIVHRVPPPQGEADGPQARALIFDSMYDQYRGVVAFVRGVKDGTFRKDDPLLAFVTRLRAGGRVEEVGIFSPDIKLKTDVLHAGEVGYIIPGVKEVADLRVGDTLTNNTAPARLRSLALATHVTPLRWCSAGCSPSTARTTLT